MRKGPAPKFDHESAKRMREDGASLAKVAARFGVSPAAVWRVTAPRGRETFAENVRRRQQQGTCQECGGPCSSNGSSPAKLCAECAAFAKVLVREGEAWCSDCEAWLPKERFTRESSRRGVRGTCRNCDTARRRAYRHRHSARHRVVDRAHKAVRAAVRRGELIRPKFCEDCDGAPARIEAHHEDYSKPLEVDWLCRLCHQKRHVVRSDAVT